MCWTPSPGGTSRVPWRAASCGRSGRWGGRSGPVRLGTFLRIYLLPPPPRPRPAVARTDAPARHRGGSRASASFPSGSSECTTGVVRGFSRAVVVARSTPLLCRSTPPRLRLSTSAGAVVACVGPIASVWGLSRRAPRFLTSRVVRPAPVRVPSCRVPARRFKDPWGGRPSAPGVGGAVGPVGEVGPSGGFPGSSSPGSLQTLYGPSPAAAAFSRGCVRCGWRCREPPLGARGGPCPAHRLARSPRGPAVVAGAGASRVVRVPCLSRSPTLLVFLFPHTCLVSFLADRPEANPRSVLSLRRGTGGGIEPSARESAHTRDKTDTTLSGGSLGSCVDEERS